MIKTKNSSIFLAVAVVIAAVAFSGCTESETKSYDDAAWLEFYNQSNEEILGDLVDLLALFDKPETVSNMMSMRESMRGFEQIANNTLDQSKEYRVSPELEGAKDDYEEALVKFAAFGNGGAQAITDILDGKTGSGTDALLLSMSVFMEGTEAFDRSESKIANFTGTTS